MHPKDVIRVANNLAHMPQCRDSITLRELLGRSIILLVLADAGEGGMNKDELARKALETYSELMEAPVTHDQKAEG